MWKSNPPPVPRRNASPALKAGKVTGPLSPPQLEYHHNMALIGDRKPPAFLQSSPVLLGGVGRDPGNGLVQVRNAQTGVPLSHAQSLVPHELCDVAKRRTGLTQTTGGSVA